MRHTLAAAPRILMSGLKPSLSTLKPRRGFHNLSQGFNPQRPGMSDLIFLDLPARFSRRRANGEIGHTDDQSIGDNKIATISLTCCPLS